LNIIKSETSTYGRRKQIEIHKAPQLRHLHCGVLAVIWTDDDYDTCFVQIKLTDYRQ